MCFRPSAVATENSAIQKGTCPSCGMPVAAQEGVTSGECPHCGKPIPLESAGNGGGAEAGKNVRIL